jgi:tRNA(Arg) A34 adenosine deaminase TadA
MLSGAQRSRSISTGELTSSVNKEAVEMLRLRSAPLRMTNNEKPKTNNEMEAPNPDFMREAIRLSIEKMQAGFGGPFGAVVVKDGQIIARGFNQVTTTHDPTCHAEVDAIRKACQALGTFQLDGCDLYTSCEPCPMCLGAIYWARPARVFYGNTKTDAAAVGFDDHFIYDEIDKPLSERSIPMQQLLPEEAIAGFQAWEAHESRTEY